MLRFAPVLNAFSFIHSPGITPGAPRTPTTPGTEDYCGLRNSNPQFRYSKFSKRRAPNFAYSCPYQPAPLFNLLITNRSAVGVVGAFTFPFANWSVDLTSRPRSRTPLQNRRTLGRCVVRARRRPIQRRSGIKTRARESEKSGND